MSFEKPRVGSREKSDPLAEYRRALRDNPDDLEALQRLQGELERRGMRGAFVPVEISKISEGISAILKENRWVEWKKVNDANGQEIPGRIEKIVRVKLIAEPVEAQIAKGHYDYDYLSGELTSADREIQPQSDEQELFLPQFDCDDSMSTEDIERWLDENNLRGASLQELLAVGAQMTEEQRRVYIIALDQAWRSRAWVPVLGGDVRVRGVSVTRRDHQWDQNVRPLAARKTI